MLRDCIDAWDDYIQYSVYVFVYYSYISVVVQLRHNSSTVSVHLHHTCGTVIIQLRRVSTRGEPEVVGLAPGDGTYDIIPEHVPELVLPQSYIELRGCLAL